MSPNNIFVNDHVSLICFVNITTYSNVSWYFNGTQKIENDLNWSYTTTSVSGGIQSNLTIKKSALNNSGKNFFLVLFKRAYSMLKMSNGSIVHLPIY